MNLRQIKSIAPKVLHDFLFNENLLGNDTDILDKTKIETKGDLLDLAQLIEDSNNFHLHRKEGNRDPFQSPIDDFIQISQYLNISYGLFLPKEAREHLKDHPFLNLYPNLYRTMEVWAWG